MLVLPVSEVTLSQIPANSPTCSFFEKFAFWHGGESDYAHFVEV